MARHKDRGNMVHDRRRRWGAGSSEKMARHADQMRSTALPRGASTPRRTLSLLSPTAHAQSHTSGGASR